MAPPPLSLPLCVVSTSSGSPHLVCYCVRESNGEGFRDGFNLWAACQQQAVTVSLQEDRALMTLSGDTSALTFDLSKVPSPEAALRLQALTLSLAKRVCNLERQLAEETTARPRKNTQPAVPHLFLAELDHQRGSSGPGVRKRCPGESLINPGFKSKKPSGGVDFDET
ncbi:protein PAXX isoform X5 [Meriones unguiculatus]|uniref:protein PAXX isoform X5 n=1 Tax=Meriones unguiculatus TaxID=10047 RepID=UPI00293E1AFC|nr:protein PAXX isoform X5 [Meriones unguiculatus]